MVHSKRQCQCNAACSLLHSCASTEAKQQQNGSSAGSSDALEQLVAASGKLALLDRMMEKLVAGGHRCDAGRERVASTTFAQSALPALKSSFLLQFHQSLLLC